MAKPAGEGAFEASNCAIWNDIARALDLPPLKGEGATERLAARSAK